VSRPPTAAVRSPTSPSPPPKPEPAGFSLQQQIPSAPLAAGCRPTASASPNRRHRLPFGGGPAVQRLRLRMTSRRSALRPLRPGDSHEAPNRPPTGTTYGSDCGLLLLPTARTGKPARHDREGTQFGEEGRCGTSSRGHIFRAPLRPGPSRAPRDHQPRVVQLRGPA